jgi:hypothetical protein
MTNDIVMFSVPAGPAPTMGPSLMSARAIVIGTKELQALSKTATVTVINRRDSEHRRYERRALNIAVSR